MATHRSGHRPAGGLHSKQTIHKPQPKFEPRAKAMSVERVSQIGATVSFRKPPLEEGRGYNAPVGPTSTLVSGPGGGRTVMKSGSQGQHGAVDRGMPSGMGSTKGEWPD
jgi:hypothetical protein